MRIDIAVGVENILRQASRTATADAIELWPDHSPFASHLVAGRAVDFEQSSALLRVSICSIEGLAPCCDDCI